jgi:hypothetical protein
LFKLLQTIQDLRKSKVVIAFVRDSTYWKVALAAHAKGMVSGYAWIGLNMDASTEYAPDDQRANANLAFNGWVYFKPHVSASRDFFDRVHNATRFDFPTLFDENVFPSPYAASIYDAITLFATVANEQGWLPEQGGRAFIDQSIGNMSFQGATGSVKLDKNGDALLSSQAVNLVLTNGTLQHLGIGDFLAETRSYSSNGIAIVWPGGVYVVPAEAVAESFSTLWVLVGSGSAAFFLVGGVVVVLRRRQMYLQAIFRMLVTEIADLVGTLCLDVSDLLTDGIACFRLMNGDFRVPSEGYRMAYLTIFCFGVAGTVLSVGYRLRSARLVREQIRAQAQAHKPLKPGESVTLSEARQHEQRYKWELLQTHRTKIASALALMTAVLQGAFTLHDLMPLEAKLAGDAQVCPCRSLTAF